MESSIVSRRWRGCDPATRDGDRLVTFSGGSGASAAQVVDPESGPAENRTPEPLIKSAEPEQTEPTSANEPPKIAETAGGNAARPPQYAGSLGSSDVRATRLKGTRSLITPNALASLRAVALHSTRVAGRCDGRTVNQTQGLSGPPTVGVIAAIQHH